MATTLAEIVEGTTPTYTATIKDETGAVVAASTLGAARLTFYATAAGTIVNTRNSQNIKNANNVTISELGVLTWKLLEADTVLTVPKPELGKHRAVFVFEWNDLLSVPRQMVHEVTFVIRRAANAPFAS